MAGIVVNHDHQINVGQTTAAVSYTHLFDYAGNPDFGPHNNPIDAPKFIGIAVTGTPVTSPTWLIKELTYDAQWRVISKVVSVGAWSNRAQLAYQQVTP